MTEHETMQFKVYDSVYYHDELVFDDNCLTTLWCFDMDFTLIATKSGKAKPINYDDWKPLYYNIIDKFSKEPDKKIIIFTNQSSSNKGPAHIEQLISKFTNILQFYKILDRTALYILTDKDKHRKPHTHAWKLFLQNHQNLSVNKETTFYCGDAGGRYNDFSSFDRYFAVNNCLKYITPEQFFNDDTVDYDEIVKLDPYTTLFNNQKNNFTKETIAKLCNSRATQLIVLTGMKGAGKTTLTCLFINSGFSVINQTNVLQFKQLIDTGKNIVVDSENHTVESRKGLLELTPSNYKKMSLLLLTNELLCKHHSMIKVEVGEMDKHLTKTYYNDYKKAFTKPSIDEGFDEVYNIEFMKLDEFDCKEYNFCYDIE